MIKRFFKFGLISGSGFIADLIIYSILLGLDIKPFYSNIFSSICAVSLVYVTSGRFIFFGNKLSINTYTIWIIYQAINIFFFSYILLIIIYNNFHPVISKIIIVPFSFILNYIIIKFLFCKE